MHGARDVRVRSKGVRVWYAWYARVVCVHPCMRACVVCTAACVCVVYVRGVRVVCVRGVRACNQAA